MFDIGFSEILAIAIVALIVIGPERLPKVARTLGHLFGRMQRYANDVKADITREMELEELKKLQDSMRDAVHSVEQSVHKEISTTESELNDIAGSSSSAASPPPVTESETPLVAETASAAEAAPSPQLELGLDASRQARKQA